MGLMGLEGDEYVRYGCALQCVRKMTNLQQAMTLYDEDLQKIKNSRNNGVTFAAGC